MNSLIILYCLPFESIGVMLTEFYEKNDLSTDDLFAVIMPFRMFRIKDYKFEPILIKGNDSWINSTEIFPRKYQYMQMIYESEFIKVDLYRNIINNEVVNVRYEMM